MALVSSSEGTVEQLIHEYISTCKLYGCKPNAGALTTLRFSLPSLRVSGDFHDKDMLALVELFLPHCNSTLSYIKRLDFTIATKEGKLHNHLGFKSHGAFTLAQLLKKSENIREVYMQRNKVGAYGGSAIFLAAANNPTLETLNMRHCRIGERGAKAFAEHVVSSGECGLRDVDLSVNHVGFAGSIIIEEALAKRKQSGIPSIEVDLTGNLVFQEIMNGLTHGLGIILCIVGNRYLSDRVKDRPPNFIICCKIYSVSLIVLYVSSTLFHSFFALITTHRIFSVIDKCAIYILIAGSYTPFLGISLKHEPIWSTYLLAFIWACCLCGIFVAGFCSQWVHKGKFSLAMYLGMGWACMICMPDLMAVLPRGAINLITLGGVGYTSGVPFFVRNNNLDHSIWHCFVLGGSIFHWFGVYSYVALLPD